MWCVCVYLQGCSVYLELAQFVCHNVCAVLRSGPQSVLDLGTRSWTSHRVEPGGGSDITGGKSHDSVYMLFVFMC